MAKRKIININLEDCNGCALCIPNCPEGAIQIIDKKARLISDLFCDGLGACLGHCPQGAINIVEREAEEYNERMVMENIVKQGKNTIIAHLKHLKEHNQEQYLQEALDFLKERKIEVGFGQVAQHTAGHAAGDFSGCPGTRLMDFRKKEETPKEGKISSRAESQLRQWPVQLMLVPASAPYLQNADLLIAADCVPFAYANFHEDLLKAKTLLVGCPKLDDVGIYQEKLDQILKNNDIKSVTYAHMEVPCCFGLVGIIQSAIQASGKKVTFQEIVISISGERIKMIFKCPGQDKNNITAETLKCLKCGYEREIFSDEIKSECPRCQNISYREILPTCIDWCKHAKECVGEKAYNFFIKHKFELLKDAHIKKTVYLQKKG